MVFSGASLPAPYSILEVGPLGPAGGGPSFFDLPLTNLAALALLVSVFMLMLAACACFNVCSLQSLLLTVECTSFMLPSDCENKCGQNVVLNMFFVVHLVFNAVSPPVAGSGITWACLFKTVGGGVLELRLCMFVNMFVRRVYMISFGVMRLCSGLGPRTVLVQRLCMFVVDVVL